MVVYADELFALNGIVNYLLLLASARLGGVLPVRGRLLAAAVLGGAYALCAMLPELGFLTGCGMKLAMLGLMVLTAFGRERQLGRLALAFGGLSTAYAGVVLAFAALFGAQVCVRNGVVCYPVSDRAMVLTAGLTYAGTALVLNRKRPPQSGALTTASLRLDGRSLCLTTLLDTGCTLTDPVNNRYVLLAEWEAVRELFGPKVRSCLEDRQAAGPADWMQRLASMEPRLRPRLLPYRVVGGSGLLLALRCDEIRVENSPAVSGWVAILPEGFAGQETYHALIGYGG